MNLLGAILYDPSSAATKACTANIAMTALDTTNLRLVVTVPAHGYIRVKMSCAIEGATTYPQILLGVMEGSTVRGRIAPQMVINGTALATTRAVAVAEFTIAGLTPGAMTLDAAYGVEFLVAASNIRYGGPNNTTASDAWGGFSYEIWDPRPLPTAAPGAANGIQIAGSNAATTYATLTSTGAFTVNGVSAVSQTGDSFARLGAPAGASVSADVAAVKSQTAAIETDTQDIQSRIPTALVSGRIDASVGAMAANVLTATAINADAITAAKLAADVTTEVQSGLATAANLATLQTSVNDVPTNAELATALAGADDAVLAAIAALNNLSQANIRTAIGLATANLDTQLADLPTNSELTTALASADDATLAAVAALNNLSSAQVQTAATAALTAYDPPTRTEATADKDEVLTAVADVPTNAELATALASADDAVLAAITAATSPLATQASLALVKAKTDSLTFTNAGEVDANTHSINDVAVGGTGSPGDEWGPA